MEGTRPPVKNNLKSLIFLVILVLGAIVIFAFFYFKKPKNIPSSSSVISPSFSSTARESPKTEIPLNSNFAEILAKLNTPEKLVSFLNENFVFEEKESDFAQKPEDFFKTKKGNRADVAAFCSFFLFKNGYFSTIFRYKFLNKEGKEEIKTLTLFVENKETKAIDLENLKLKIIPAGTSPFDFLGMEEEKYNIKIKEYAAFTFGTIDFTKGDWLPR